MQMTKAFGRVLLDAGADLLHHLEIDVEQIVAAHARLARHAGGDDADIGAFDRLVGVGAGEAGVEIVDRRGSGDVERLALRHALHDVEHDDVAELLEADEMSQRAADLTGADQRNLVTRHGGKLFGMMPRGDGVVLQLTRRTRSNKRKGAEMGARCLCIQYASHGGKPCRGRLIYILKVVVAAAKAEPAFYQRLASPARYLCSAGSPSGCTEFAQVSTIPPCRPSGSERGPCGSAR